MQNLDTSAAITRFVTQPESVDIPDLEGWQAKVAVARGILQGIEVKRIKEFDNILPIFTKGEYEGKKVSRQGISPYEAMYVESKDSTKIVEGVHDWMTFMPQVYNADSMGYRPDLIGPADHRVEGVDQPGVQGQGGDPRRAQHRHHGRGPGFRIARRRRLQEQGQHDARRRSTRRSTA